LSLTLVPVLASLLLRPRSGAHEPRFMGRLRRLYLRLLDACLRRRVAVAAAALAVLLAAAAVATRMGAEFIPRLDEGDITLQAVRVSSVGLSEAVAGT